MKRTLSFLFALVMLMTCGFGQTFAEVQINNQLKNSDSNTVILSSASDQMNGLELIRSTGEQNYITMPDVRAYMQPVPMYIDSPGGHSVYVYRTLELDKEKLMPFAYDGMRVTAVAEQKVWDTSMTCIVYRDENFRLHAGWVHSAYLNAWFPGAVETVGSTCDGTFYTVADPVLSWGRNYFVNTKQKYTVLSQPIHECTQFSLNYQVTDRRGASVDEIVGPRTVYVNDGSGWEEVAQFDYSKIQSVLITVNLPEPMDLLAVATIPAPGSSERFAFRQTVLDVLTADANALSVGSSAAQTAGTAELTWDPQQSAVIINETPARTVRRGSVVTYGMYEQDNYAMGSREPIEWIVLDVQEDRLLLISNYALDCLSYCSRKDTTVWETSNVRAWLNDQFLNAAFTVEEQSSILVTEVDNSKSQGYIHYPGDGGNNTQDQIFLLSYAEAWKYFYQNSDRACKPTKAAIRRGAFESGISGNCPWWLRSPGYTSDYVAGVDVDGNRGGNVKYGTLAIRPAMWVDISAVQSFGYILG